MDCEFSKIRLKGGLIFPILLIVLLIFRFQVNSDWLAVQAATSLCSSTLPA